MLKLIDYGKENYPEESVFLLGYFDAVHVGHRALIASALSLAKGSGKKVGIMTFYDAKNGAQVYVFEERLQLFEKLGIDFVCAANFNENFKNTEGKEFLDTLVRSLNVKAFVCGEDFTYGKGAGCGVSDLKNYCALRNIDVQVLPLVSACGEKAAASFAKRLLDEGDLSELEKLLGGKYFIFGNVETEGRHIGRKLGFPTANIHLSPQKYPIKTGVYAVSVVADGKLYRGIANYGTRPTFGDQRVIAEVYIDGYSGDLYGKEITVFFDFRIRDIKKFASAEALKRQLIEDLEKIR